MWERVEKGCEWKSPRALSVRLLFRDERAIPALLEFLDDTRVGRVPSLALLGMERDEEELGEIELWPQAGEDWSGESGEEGGFSPP